MSGQLVAAEGLPWPPSVGDFYPPDLAGPWVTKFTLMVWLAVGILIIFFMATYRNPKLVPSKGQWYAESIYGLVRDNIAREQMGKDGIRFAPYFTVLFCFIAVTNLFGVTPGLQISPNSHIAFPIVLAAITYVMYLYIGVRKQGLGRYLKQSLIIPGVPWPMHFLLIPIEFLQNFINRPVTLAVRLFANMFAGHLILLVFTVGGFVMLASDNIFIQATSIFSFLMAILMAFFEVLVSLLQAYVFVTLTANYIGTSLADGH
ncbi:F-type H+-transporting ATPase subunit a [Micromonospora phaseoli]|uniref:ATP synthase subunit a n=1 Tax=Micromonospora phaseoli TaxID=1144548 RepID=A0A1H6WHC7_9ACTN|nr:F0F1 ATP synthase subunit A [Micromonospora phaseoli]PZW01768.1 ATP synthase F0 subcomplex A subunit [Micromonospora phaseoli]GIJ78152.1 ATP synthase subunit a [Micromonospora phaseoli]SEJ15116.1 F-type H+-transporting ATPase subunit a [Micromonospora phaseoli]